MVRFVFFLKMDFSGFFSVDEIPLLVYHILCSSPRVKIVELFDCCV